MWDTVRFLVTYLLPPFATYLIIPIFMGMVFPSRLRRWWQIVLLSGALALTGLPRQIWGMYSAPATFARVLDAVLVLIVIPLIFFEGPVWKRLILNLLMYGGQVVGEGLGMQLLLSPDRLAVRDYLRITLSESVAWTMISVFSDALVDCGIVALARTMKSRELSGLYCPLAGIMACLMFNYYAYISRSRLIWCVCMVLCGVCIICLLYYIISLEKKNELEEELRDLRRTMELEQSHFQAVQERREELSRIRHDFNNHLAAIGQLLQTGGEQDAQVMIRRLREDIAGTRENVYCGIPVVNAVLSEKERICREKGIRFLAELHIPDQIAVNPLHLCSIFSNLMDNSIHGAADTEQPSISLTSAVAGDYLFIKTVNPAGQPQEPAPGHGYGSRILCRLAEQYEGGYQTSYENGVYTAMISLLTGAPDQPSC